MASQGNDQNADLYFSAELQDNVSPQADQIAKRLQQLGASRHEIKMFLQAYDQATPKIKATQEQLKKLPKDHMINIRTNADAAHRSIQKLKDVAAAPITLTVHVKDNVDQYIQTFKAKFQRLEYEMRNSVKQMPITGALIGATSTAANMMTGPLQAVTGIPTAGVGLGAAGMVAAVSGTLAKSFSMNSQMEQNMAQLTQLLRSNTAATQEVRGVVQFATKTPFNMPDVLQADIQLRQAGINPTNKAMGLRAAGNLAAGTQVPLQQAQGAVIQSSLGYFESLNNITGRNIRQSDFGYGQRFTGMTYQEATQQVLKQYTGALQAQTQTFKGLATNIQDVVQQKVIRPITGGAGQGQTGGLFSIARGMESQINAKLGSDSWQLGLSRTMDKVQQGLIKVFALVQQGASYFKSSLEKPLEDVAKNVIKVGAAMGKAFGGTLVTGVKYLSEGLVAIIQPLTTIARVAGSIHFPFIGTIPEVMGTVKALHMFGISTNTGFKDFFAGMSSLNLGRAITGIREFTSLIGKLSLFIAVKSFLDMKTANEALGSSFSKLGSSAGDSLDSLKLKFDSLIIRANMLGKSVAQIKQYGATFGTAVEPQLRAGHRTGDVLGQAEYFGGIDIARMSASTKIGGAQMAQITSTWAKQMNVGGWINRGLSPQKAADDVSVDIMQAGRQLASSLKIDLKSAVILATTALVQFHSALVKANIGTPAGASLAGGIDATLRKTMTAKDYAKFGGPDEMTNWLLTGAVAPGPEILKKALHQRGGLAKSFSFFSDTPNAPWGHDTQATRDASKLFSQYARMAPSSLATDAAINRQLNQQSGGGNFSAVGTLNNALGGNAMQLPIFKSVLPSLGVPNLSQSQIEKMSPDKSAQLMIKLASASDQVNQKIQDTQSEITKLNNVLDEYGIKQEQATAALAKFSLAHEQATYDIQKQQNAIQMFTLNAINPLQRAIAATAQATADYQQHQMVPIQRSQEDWNQTMLLTSNRLEDVTFKLGLAQFNMGKFHDGMLKGENALTAQIQSLTIYNQKLDMLRLLNMGLQADITKTQFHQGFTSTVKPLMGFDLAREIQLGQERQQMMQDRYNITYGNEHWKLDRAARPLFQRMEMPFDQRMKGVLSQRSIIDTATLDTRAIQNLQYQEQLKSRLLEEAMYKATVNERPLQDRAYEQNKQMFHLQQKVSVWSDNISKKSLIIADAQLPLTRASQHISDVIGTHQPRIDAHLLVLNQTLGQYQNAVADLRSMSGSIGKNFSNDVQKGQKNVEKFLYTIAQNTGASHSALQGLHNLIYGGGPGGSPPFNPHGQSRNIGGPGPVNSAVNAITGLINPLTWIQTGSDAARAIGHQIGGSGLGTIAGFGALGLGALSAANVARIGVGRAVGGHLLPNLANRLVPAGSSPEWIADHGARAFLAKFTNKWGEIVKAGVPLEQLTRPFAYLYTLAARVAGFGVGAAVSHAVPIIGPALAPLTGYGVQELVEKKVSEWMHKQGSGWSRGRFIGTRTIARGLRGIVGTELNSLGEHGFGQLFGRGKNAFARARGLFNVATIGLPRTLVSIPGQLAEAGGHGIASLAREARSQVKGASSLLSAANAVATSPPVVDGTREKPFVTVIEDGRRFLGGVAAKFATNVADAAAGGAGTAETYVKAAASTIKDGGLGIEQAAKDFRASDKTIGGAIVSAANHMASSAMHFSNTVTDNAKAATEFKNSTKTDRAAAERTAKAATEQHDAAKTSHEAAKENTKSSHTVKEASARAEDSSKRVGRASKVEADAAEHLKGSAGKFGTFIGHMGEHVARFGRIGLRIGGAASLLMTGVDAFGSHVHFMNGIVKGFNDIASFMNKSIGFFRGGISSFIGAVSDFTRYAADLLHIHPSRAAGTIFDTIGKGLSRGANWAGGKLGDLAEPAMKWGGRILRGAGVAGGVASFIPGIADLASGNIKGGIGNLINTGMYGSPFSAAASPLMVVKLMHDMGLGQASFTKGGIGPFDLGALKGFDPLDAKTWWGLRQKARTNDIQDQQKHNSMTVQLMSKNGQDMLSAQVDNSKQARALKKQYNDLNTKDQDAFQQALLANQTGYQDAAITGSNGLKDWLTRIEKGHVNHYGNLLSLGSNYYKTQNKNTDSGFKGISGTSTNWLNSMTDQIKHWEKINGLNLTTGKGTSSKEGLATARAAAVTTAGIISVANTSLGSFEHGGVIKSHAHGDVGRGRIVRMVEEGHPEMVIPLAPHRRDRAKSLIEQARGLIGYAGGGIISTDTGERLKGAVLATLPATLRAQESRNHSDILPGMAAGGVVDGISGVTPGSRLAAMIRAANAIDAHHFPYLWGGGHSSSTMGGPYDCSGAVSALLRASGYFSSGQTEVSGWFDNQFLPGAGAATLYSNPTHVYMDIGGRGWGTSLSNPGGGAGWFVGGARPGFAVHHLPGLDSSVSPKQLAAWAKAEGGSGAAAPVNVPPIKLKNPPMILNSYGAIGGMQYKILLNNAKMWQNRLNKQAQAEAGAGGGGGVLGPSPAGGFNQQTWAQAFLRGLGISPSGTDVRNIMAWEAQEGGNWNNTARFNPLNTTQTPASGSFSNTGSQGNIKAYSSWNQGLAATIETIKNGNYGGILAALRSNASLGAFESAVSSSPWGTHFAGGIENVPRDNFPALLHAGERVLTAGEHHTHKRLLAGGPLQQVAAEGSHLIMENFWKKLKAHLDQMHKDHKSWADIQNYELKSINDFNSKLYKIANQQLLMTIEAGIEGKINPHRLTNLVGSNVAGHIKGFGSDSSQAGRMLDELISMLHNFPKRIRVRVALPGHEKEFKHLEHQLAEVNNHLKANKSERTSLHGILDELKTHPGHLKDISHKVKDLQKYFEHHHDTKDAKSLNKVLSELQHGHMKAAHHLLERIMGGLDKHHHNWEEHKHDINKRLKAISTTTYKITGYHDVAQDINKLRILQEQLHSDKKHHKGRVSADQHQIHKLSGTIKQELHDFTVSAEKKGYDPKMIKDAIDALFKGQNQNIISDKQLGKFFGIHSGTHGESASSVHGKKTADNTGKTAHNTDKTAHHGKQTADHTGKTANSSKHTNTNLKHHTAQVAKNFEGRQSLTHKHIERANHHIKVHMDHIHLHKDHLKAASHHYGKAESADKVAHKQRSDVGSQAKVGFSDASNYHQKSQRQFEKMVHHLKHMSDRVDKLSPKVNNNITIELDGKPQRDYKYKTKVPRNR